MYSSITLPKPNNENVFEEAPIELFRCVLKDPNVKKFGRRGQVQYGVDLYGKRDGDPEKYVGIQCKLKDDEKKLTKIIVKEEVGKALTFSPPLSEYFIITTAPDDAQLQRYASELEVEIKRQHGRTLSIQIWGWNTITIEAQKYPSAHKAFDPTFVPHYEPDLVTVKAGITLTNETLTLQTAMLGEILRNQSISIDTDARNPLETLLDKEIDAHREHLRGENPKLGLELLSGMLTRLPENVSGRIQFRIKANMAACHIALGNTEEADSLIAEACEHAPDEPKADVNLAFMYLRRGDWQKAVETAEAGLTKHPDNAELAGALVQAWVNDDGVDDPLSLVDHDLVQTEHVQVSYLFFLRQRERAPEWREKARELKSKYPDQAFVVRAAAEATLDEIVQNSRISEFLPLTDEQYAHATEALDQLLKLWEKFQDSSLPPQQEHLSLAANIILTCDLLEDHERGSNIVNQASDAIWSDHNVCVRIAQFGVNFGDAELIEKAIDKMDHSADRLRFSFLIQLQRKEWRNLATTVASMSPDEYKPDQALISYVKSIAEYLVPNDQYNADKIVASLPERWDDIRCAFVAHQVLREFGFADEASTLFERIYQHAIQTDDVPSKFMTARRLANDSRWELVPRLLSGVINPSMDTAELRMLATAYANVPFASKQAVTFFSNLSPEIADTPYYLERMSAFHFNRKALTEAEKCYRRLISIATETVLNYYLSLFSIFIRQRKPEQIQPMLEAMEADEAVGTPSENCILVHMIAKYGSKQKAIEIAYKNLVKYPNNPEVHSAYCALIMFSTAESDDQLIPAAPLADHGTWVRMEDVDGQSCEILISDRVESEASHLFPFVADKTSHALARRCLGMGVGARILIRDAFATEDTVWTLREIKSRYLQAFHILLDQSHVRFPEASQIGRMKIDPENLDPFLDRVRHHSEYHINTLKYYTEKDVPLVIVASFHSCTSIQFANFVKNSGEYIATCAGNRGERTSAFRLIEHYANRGVVVDAYTAWTLASLNSFDVIASVFGDIIIPQSCIDELIAILHELENFAGESFSLSWRQGQFFREEHSLEDKKRQIDLVKDIIDRISSACSQTANVFPDEVSAVGKRYLELELGSSLDPIFCCSEHEALLLSEDMHLRRLAYQDFAIPGVWIQSVIMYAFQRGHINVARYSELCAELATYAHNHTAVGSDMLAHLASQDDLSNDERFESLARWIGTEKADIHSHLEVSIDTLREIWSTQGIDWLRKRRLTGVLVENLLRRRTEDWHHILAWIFDQSTSDAREYLIGWVSGHFLPVGEFRKALDALVGRISTSPSPTSRR